MRITSIHCESKAIPKIARWRSGVASLDTLLAGGFSYGGLHEIYAVEVADAAAAAGFTMALSNGMDKQARGLLWLRSRRSFGGAGILQANGWAELGGTPAGAVVGLLPDNMTLLRAAVDALRCKALGAVIVEGWGTMCELDLTANRRLVLAAEKSGVPLLLLRIDAAPVASAAQTRWQVAAAPSRALSGNAPGRPTFDITLLRQRSGPAGHDWRVEWDRDLRQFREAPLSGAVVSVPADRPATDRARTRRVA